MTHMFYSIGRILFLSLVSLPVFAHPPVDLDDDDPVTSIRWLFQPDPEELLGSQNPLSAQHEKERPHSAPSLHFPEENSETRTFLPNLTEKDFGDMKISIENNQALISMKVARGARLAITPDLEKATQAYGLDREEPFQNNLKPQEQLYLENLEYFHEGTREYSPFIQSISQEGDVLKLDFYLHPGHTELSMKNEVCHCTIHMSFDWGRDQKFRKSFCLWDLPTDSSQHKGSDEVFHP